MAMYMLYRTKAKNVEELDNLRVQFEEIYKRNKVDIVGFWTNAEAEDEFFYMSRYKDEADYKIKVDQLRKDEDYIRLGKELKDARLEFSATKLVPKWIPE